MKESMSALTASLYALPGIVLTILCWGMYGPVLHKGQEKIVAGGASPIETRLKPLICVGIAYFVVAIILPGIYLAMQGRLGGGWQWRGMAWSFAAGSAGAIGALGIVIALTAGGKPHLVMPMVFGGAPIVSVLMSVWLSNQLAFRDLNLGFLTGIALVGIGAAVVLVSQPRPSKGHATVPGKAVEASSQSAPTKVSPPERA